MFVVYFAQCVLRLDALCATIAKTNLNDFYGSAIAVKMAFFYDHFFAPFL
jgi:hypothetical protein